MRRGFKTWCENAAVDYRSVLRLKPSDPLNPEDLAAHLGVEVWRPEDVPGFSRDSLQQLTIHDQDSWSAVTLRLGDTNLIILNSTHATTRQRNSLTHELAHIMLDHEPSRIDVSSQGHLLLSSFEQEQEEEANWFSATLLVPRAGLQVVYRKTKKPHSLAEHFGVSLDLLNWRLRMTGVVTQARRASRWSRR